MDWRVRGKVCKQGLVWSWVIWKTRCRVIYGKEKVNINTFVEILKQIEEEMAMLEEKKEEE